MEPLGCAHEKVHRITFNEFKCDRCGERFWLMRVSVIKHIAKVMQRLKKHYKETGGHCGQEEKGR
jgi:ribosomal protein L37AE/L43A